VGTECTVEGVILYQKIGWDVNTGKPLYTYWTFDGHIIVDYATARFTLHHPTIFPVPWVIEGTVLSSSET
jgi:hypothetical protein